MTGEEAIRWAHNTFGHNVCITSSMTDAVVIDMVSKIIPQINVYFLDTGSHFAETLATRDRVEEVYPVNVITVYPQEISPAFRCGTDLCCTIRKVVPLRRALANYSAYFTGIRHEESAERENASMIEWDEQFGLVKINPIIEWSQKDVDRYIEDNDVIVNPLLAEGYTSIGCAPATIKPTNDDPRSGRWHETSKTECGLHR